MTAANRLPVLKGTLDLLVLRALSWTPMHGFEIVSWLERAANQSLDLDDSALYQAVYRLEARGLLEADWGVTENNRRARYYKLSTAGRTYLRAETRNWLQYAETVSAILTAAKDGLPSAAAS
jgi:PadR family transcriptional regulator PadR